VSHAAPVMTAQVASLDLAPVARSSGLGRRFVTEALQGWGLHGLLDAAALLTSEIVTNAVLHARTRVRLTVRRDGPDTVTVSVSDGSRLRPQLRLHSQSATTGRGIQLLQQLASSWEVAVDEHGDRCLHPERRHRPVGCLHRRGMGSRPVSDEPVGSPLGRYDEPCPDAELHKVRLLRLPVRVLAAGREHHDALVHECSLLALAEPGESGPGPSRLIELVEKLGVRYAAAAARPDAVVDEALARGDVVVDLTYRVPAHVIEAVDILERLMAEADEYSRQEQLLTPARTPLVASFSAWYLEEFRRQIAGHPPRAWEGPTEVPS